MKNGRADHHDDDPARDPKIARIEEARRRRQLGLAEPGKAGERRSSSKPRGGNIKELLFGAVIVVMAAGFLVHLTRPLWQGFSFAP